MPDFLEPTEGAPPGFPFAEKIAAQKAGLSEQDARALRQRHLRKDVDFKYHLKAIFLTASAVKKIAPHLVVSDSEKTPAAGIASQCEAIKSGPVKLLVVRNDLPNRHLLLCCAEGEDPDRPKKTMRVRVKAQEGFRLRMAIEASLVAGFEDLYDFVGKYPRRKTTTNGYQ